MEFQSNERMPTVSTTDSLKTTPPSNFISKTLKKTKKQVK